MVMLLIPPIVHGNAFDTTSGGQMMNYSHVEKYLNRNEYLKLNIKFKVVDSRQWSDVFKC